MSEKNMIDFNPMKNKQDTPKVGVAVFLEQNGKILMMKRKGSHRQGTWALPGGHMDVGETFFDTCKREVKEEIGITITSVEKFDFCNAIFLEEGLHYVTLYFKAKWNNHDTPFIMEPDKIEEIKWVDPSNPPQPIFSIPAFDMMKEYSKRKKKTIKQLIREVYWERG